jgi:hypothetical protein
MANFRSPLGGLLAAAPRVEAAAAATPERNTRRLTPSFDSSFFMVFYPLDLRDIHRQYMLFVLMSGRPADDPLTSPLIRKVPLKQFEAALIATRSQ